MTRGLITVKQEKISTLPISKKTQLDLNVKTSGSRKRKTSEATDMCLENLNVEDSLGKLESFSQAIS